MLPEHFEYISRHRRPTDQHNQTDMTVVIVTLRTMALKCLEINHFVAILF